MNHEEQVAQVMAALSSNGQPAQSLVRSKAPGIIQRIVNPEVNEHYHVEQTNRHLAEETAELITAVGFVTTHAVAVKLQTLSSVEGLITAHASSALARAYAPAIAAHAIQVMDGAIGGALEGYAESTSATMRSRRR